MSVDDNEGHEEPVDHVAAQVNAEEESAVSDLENSRPAVQAPMPKPLLTTTIRGQSMNLLEPILHQSHSTMTVMHLQVFSE
jgi:hypothetical protein